MSHTFAFSSGSFVTVYMEKRPEDVSVLMAEHNVLDATHSVYQYMGAKSPTANFSFWLYGAYWNEWLKGNFISGSIFVYTDHKASSGSYVPLSYQSDEQMDVRYPDKWYKCNLKAAYLYSTGSLYYQP